MAWLPLLFSLFAVGYGLTADEQVYVSSYLLNFLEKAHPAIESVRGDIAASWVRLCFHDAATWNRWDKTGGNHAWMSQVCNDQKCERNLAANGGLGPIADGLNALWANITGGYNGIKISKADFWYLSCKVSIEWASGKTVRIPFGWGRTDAPATPLRSWPDRHPDASHGLGKIRDLFIGLWGFYWEETVALMGAHSMGRARIANSGYEGRWNPLYPNQFSNIFYRNLLNTQYEYYRQVLNSPQHGFKIQFQSPKLGGIALFSDAQLAYNISGFPPQCNLTNDATGCGPTPNMAQMFTNFATSNYYWLQIFASAWKKMTEFTTDKLYYNEDRDYGLVARYPNAPYTAACPGFDYAGTPY